jgi:hypothetical protein
LLLRVARFAEVKEWIADLAREKVLAWPPYAVFGLAALRDKLLITVELQPFELTLIVKPRREETHECADSYAVAVSGALQLVPDAEALKALGADYKKMADDGILLDDAEPFADLIKRCADLEKRANARGKKD